MARQLPNQRTEYTTRVKRLDDHLVNPGDFDQSVRDRHLLSLPSCLGLAFLGRPMGSGRRRRPTSFSSFSPAY
jgi:hypothetical protein